MVDIQEKMIDNSMYIIQNTGLLENRIPNQMERKAVGVNKQNSCAADKRITKRV